MKRHIPSNQTLEILFELPNKLTPEELGTFIISYLSRKSNKIQGLHELDSTVALVQNRLSLLSFYVKQQILQTISGVEIEKTEDQYFSRKEIAKKFKVDLKTVSNWVKSGLKEITVGGIMRIKKTDLDAFIIKNRSKKFAWKSISMDRKEAA